MRTTTLYSFINIHDKYIKKKKVTNSDTQSAEKTLLALSSPCMLASSTLLFGIQAWKRPVITVCLPIQGSITCLFLTLVSVIAAWYAHVILIIHAERITGTEYLAKYPKTSSFLLKIGTCGEKQKIHIMTKTVYRKLFSYQHATCCRSV